MNSIKITDPVSRRTLGFSVLEGDRVVLNRQQLPPGAIFELVVAPSESAGAVIGWDQTEQSISRSIGFGPLTLFVNLSAPLQAPVTVEWQLTALAGMIEVLPESGFVTWDPGEFGPKPIVLDSVVSDFDANPPDSSFDLTLLNPTGGAVLDASPTLTATFADDLYAAFAAGRDSIDAPSSASWNGSGTKVVPSLGILTLSGNQGFTRGSVTLTIDLVSTTNCIISAPGNAPMEIVFPAGHPATAAGLLESPPFEVEFTGSGPRAVWEIIACSDPSIPIEPSSRYWIYTE